MKLSFAYIVEGERMEVSFSTLREAISFVRFVRDRLGFALEN